MTQRTTPTHAPVAMFVYNRLDNTRQTVEHLKRNHLASETPLYVFSDGGKDEKSWAKVNELRQYLHTIKGFKEVNIIERTENIYLERNIIEGINHVLQRHDTIIVLEDDICTSPVFLTYMNEALRKYEDNNRIMHISGFTHLDIPQYGDTYLTPFMAGWGWATWKNRWKHFVHYKSRKEALEGLTDTDSDNIQYGGNFTCLNSLDKNPIPWDICWLIQIYRRGGLCLSPTHTLIKNIGIGKGTHFNTNRLFGWYSYDRPFRTEKIRLADIPVAASLEIEKMYQTALKHHGMQYNWFGKIVRFFYLLLFKRNRR